VAALVEGLEANDTLLGLAGRPALVGRLEAMVRRVANHVGERVLDQLQHLAVELRVRPLQPELDALAELEAEVAHQPGQLAPRAADRLHARAHHAFLEFRRDVAQPLHRRLQAAHLAAAGQLEELVPSQDQLAHEIHELLEQIDPDAQGLRRDGLGAAGFVSFRSRTCLPAPTPTPGAWGWAGTVSAAGGGASGGLAGGLVCAAGLGARGARPLGAPGSRPESRRPRRD
jgi:hypothetical protein